MRKKGKKHSTIAVLPNGVRRDNKFELPVWAALMAMERGILEEKHLYDLFVLAEMCINSGGKGHYLEHAGTVKRMVCDLGDSKRQAQKLEYMDIHASATVLIEYFGKLSNVEIARAALAGLKAN